MNEDFIYLPNGELNIPFLLVNANLLLKEGEIQLAASLFERVKASEKYRHCAYYGIGQCFLKLNARKQALSLFKKALACKRRPYIENAIIDLETLCSKNEIENAVKANE